MKIRPLYDRIVVKQIAETEEKTVGGIIIPDNAKERPQQAEVVAVGQGRQLDDGQIVPLALAVGDIVLYGKYAGVEAPKLGDGYLIMRENEVLGILEP